MPKTPTALLDAPSDAAPHANGVADVPPVGFRSAARWRLVEAPQDDLAAEEGAEPFWAEVRTNIYGADLLDIETATTYLALWAALAPHVRAWNAVGDEIVTDESGNPVVEDGRAVTRAALLPPPAEAGPRVFALLDQDVVRWLKRRIAGARFEEPSRPNSSSGPNGTGGGSGGAN